MELHGGKGFVAEHRKESLRLKDKYAGDNDIGYLHAVRDHWEARVEETKKVTGRSMIHTVRENN